jgi:hypothetical protein
LLLFVFFHLGKDSKTCPICMKNGFKRPWTISVIAPTVCMPHSANEIRICRLAIRNCNGKFPFCNGQIKTSHLHIRWLEARVQYPEFKRCHVTSVNM